MNKNIIVVGAGASGIGISVVLKRLNLDFVVLERDSIGSSFKRWPKETRFISPSFTGNFFGNVDLNAITPDTSPAYSLQTEHPTGSEYARYLDGIANYHNLPIKLNVDINKISNNPDGFVLETNKGQYECGYLIWAAGEYQYPNLDSFKGAEHCVHYSEIDSWEDCKHESYYIIGAYESGFDSAYQLAKLGKTVTLLDSKNQWDNLSSDSSYSLSPYTRDRFLEQSHNIKIKNNSSVREVSLEGDTYIIETISGDIYETKSKPINATGFKSSLSIVEDFFEFKDGNVLLSENDESVKTSGLYLVGPQVKHGSAIFCFIYKYRQRFAIVAEHIAKKLKPTENVDQIISEYKKSNFYLKDLSCCDNECVC